MAWWHQAITWTSFDLPSVKFSNIHLNETKINLKITYLKFDQYSMGNWVNVSQYDPHDGAKSPAMATDVLPPDVVRQSTYDHAELKRVPNELVLVQSK